MIPDTIAKKCEKCLNNIVEEKLSGYYQINLRKHGNWRECARYRISERDAAYKKYYAIENKLGKGDDVELIIVFSEQIITTEK